MIWKILGIEQTKDEEAIKTAYRNKLRYVNPEDDEEGFKELRRAYEEALEFAGREETDGLHNVDDETEQSYSGKKDEVDLWIDRVDAVYKDVAARRDEKKWEALLHDSVCDDLDTELEAAEKLLVYFMSHTFMPQAIWQMVDKRFHYMDNYDQLKEKFPENYLDFVKWQIESPQFIDFELFDGKTDDHVDDFIEKLYEVTSALEQRDLKKSRQLLDELERFELTHPFAQVEEARYLLIKQEKEKEEPKEIQDAAGEETAGNTCGQEALSIMEELDFEYSDNPYIERIYAEALIANGETGKARAVYDAILEKSPDNYTAMLGQANCIFLEGDPENAKEQVEDILEERVQDAECLVLLNKINEKLVKDYEEKLESNLDRDICFKLGWCYYQQKKFKEGIALLDKLGDSDDYDYVNLRCRLYLADEDYEKAYPLSRKWLALIENSEEDGSKEMEKRKNRLSLAHFSVGVCIWEVFYRKEEKEERDTQFLEASSYIKKAISEENNQLVKLSYMEQLARFYLDAEAYDACIETCNEIIEKDRGFFPAYVHRQKANYELKNAKEVIDDYFACQEIYPAYVPPYVLAAEVFFAFDQYDDVEHVIQAAKEAGLDSDSLELYRIKCIHYKEFSKENLQRAFEAIQALREKISNRTQEEETDIEDMSEVERELAVIYWDKNQTDTALAVIDGFLKKHPDNVDMLHLKADVLIREDKSEDALRVCKRLVDMEPDNFYTTLKLGNCWERLGKLGRAVECYEQILEKDAEFGPALRRLMYVYSYVSSREDNLETCKKAIDYATRYIEVTGAAEGYVERGNLYIDLYELEKAVADCKKAIELDSEAYYAYNNLGCALLKLRRIEEAIEPLKQAIETDPDKDHLPYLNLAECYVLQKNYKEAIACYKEAIRLQPENVRWKKEIAKIYVLEKKYDEAVAIYQELIQQAKQVWEKTKWKEKMLSYTRGEMAPEQERVLNLYCDLAGVYRQAGSMEKAEECFNKIYSYNAGYRMLLSSVRLSPSAMAEAGEFYRDTGNLKKAEQVIKKALLYVPQNKMNSSAHSYLYGVYATIFLEQGKKEKAQKYAKLRLKQLMEEYGGEEEMLADLRYRPMHLYTLAIMNICAGSLDKAREYLKQIPDCRLCVTCETCDCFEYYYGMGLIAELENRKDEARGLYEKAIKVKGDYPEAKHHLDNL